MDARSGLELAAEVRYKGDFLQEQQDGSWQYVQIARQFGRGRVLSKEAMRQLALETVANDKINGPAQIMWFCDLPDELGLGKHLPWFRSNEFPEFDRPGRPPFPGRRVRNIADLEALDRDERCIIEVTPEVELVRENDKFLGS